MIICLANYFLFKSILAPCVLLGMLQEGRVCELLSELLITMQKGCLCALCGAIPTPIMNILKYFGDEMKSDMVKDN